MVKRGLKVQPFKKGPDFIDPLWLGHAAGTPCFNLDFFTMPLEQIKAMFAARSAASDISLIEGNKGLFDGLDLEGADCNATLAKMLSVPVVLVIDTVGITRGIAPLINGYLNFDSGVNIQGVILNKVGGSRHESKLRAALERYTDIEILGAIGKNPVLEIPERHLGLIPANESKDADKSIEHLVDSVSDGVDVDRLLEIAESAGTVTSESSFRPDWPKADVRIAIARDAAFSFYYQDDLEAFATAGAELVPFNTLEDAKLPRVDGLFIGGGFPETHLPALSQNQSLRNDIRQHLAAGMPAYTECGGLMYLSQNIRWQNEDFDMVGTIPGDIIVEEVPQGRGYVVLQETGQGLWPEMPGTSALSNEPIPAHEFHYARLDMDSATSTFAYDVVRGDGIDGQHDGLIVGALTAGFAHQRNTYSNPWVSRFVAFVRENAQRYGANILRESPCVNL